MRNLVGVGSAAVARRGAAEQMHRFDVAGHRASGRVGPVRQPDRACATRSADQAHCSLPVSFLPRFSRYPMPPRLFICSKCPGSGGNQGVLWFVMVRMVRFCGSRPPCCGFLRFPGPVPPRFRVSCCSAVAGERPHGGSPQRAPEQCLGGDNGFQMRRRGNPLAALNLYLIPFGDFDAGRSRNRPRRVRAASRRPAMRAPANARRAPGLIARRSRS